jgi:hypothetical protein
MEERDGDEQPDVGGQNLGPAGADDGRDDQRDHHHRGQRSRRQD